MARSALLFRVSVIVFGRSGLYHECADTPQGQVKRVVADRGFGSIEAGRGDDLFFRYSEVRGAGIEEFREDQPGEYQVGQGRKGPRVTQIRVALPTA